jgi:hypothetical protein
MKPGDHPDFYRLPPPPGRSRESTIRLDADGRFWHDGSLVEHAGMARAFSSWIRRHPDDGRFILSNDYDWSYFEVEDTPFFVLSIRQSGASLLLTLSDGSEERLDPSGLWTGNRGAIYVTVKAGQFGARFSPSAQLALAPYVVEGENGRPELELEGRRFAVADTPP